MKTEIDVKAKIIAEPVGELQAYLTLVFVAVLFGGNTIAMKVVSQMIPPISIALIRGVLGLCILLPFSWQQLVHGPKPDRRQLANFLLLGLIGISLPYTTLALGLQHTSATNASIIFATGAATTIIILTVFLRIAPSRPQILAIITSFVGLVIVFTRGSWANLQTFHFNPSDFFLLLNVLSVSLFCILGQEVMKKFSPVVTTVYSLLFGVLMLIPVAGWEIASIELNLPWYAWLILAYMGLVVTGVALLLNLRSIQRVGSAQAAIFSNLAPVFGILLGVLLLDELLYLYHWVGIFLVFAGVFLSIYKGSWAFPFSRSK